MEAKNRFWGCIYDAPVPDGQHPRPVDLTVREIAAMTFVGLPVRIEHQDGNVGRVIDSRTDPVTGRTEVCFELDPSASGIAARTMIQNESIQQLSLKHLVYPDRVMVPEEVSLCIQGAREKTDVYRTKNYKGAMSAPNSAAPIAVVCMSAASAPENRIYMADQSQPPHQVQMQQPMAPPQQQQYAQPVPQQPTQYVQQPGAPQYAAPVAAQQPPSPQQQQQQYGVAPIQQYVQSVVAPQVTAAYQPPAVQQPAAPVQAVHAAPAPVDGDSGAAAVARDAHGRFAPPANAGQKRSFEEVVNETVNKMNLEANPEAKRVFLDFAVQNAKSEFDLFNKVKQLADENAKLQQQRSEDLKQTEGMAEQISETIARLYKQFAPSSKVGEDDFSRGKKAMQESPDITRMLAPMVVACSNIFETNAHNQKHAMGKEIDTLQKQLSFYSQSFEHMHAPAPAQQPLFQQTAPVQQQQQWQQPAASPQVWQQPAMAPQQVVAASAHTLHPTEPMDDVGSMVNRMRQGHGAYNSSTIVNNRMPVDQLPKGFFSGQGQR